MKRVAALMLALLVGCSNLYDTYDAGSYVVQAGDTLYSIAWRHGVDPRELAAWNGLANPDRIIVGQRLRFTPAVARTPARTAAAPSASAASRATPRPPAQSAGPVWQWPATGRVLARYGEPRVLATGIGIGGSLGQDVRAAAGGRVVYVGSGLPDYGQLVIIEHNGSWLSAYGHNRRIIVTQGQSIGRGDKIAEMGSGPGGTAMLHFEIRRNGDPLDPLSVLPDSS